MRLLIFTWALLRMLPAMSQQHDTDLYGPKNSLRYAAWLEKQHDNLLAAREYERLVFTFGLDSLRSHAFRNYYLQGDYPLALHKARQLFPNGIADPGSHRLVQKLYVHTGQFQRLDSSSGICPAILHMAAEISTGNVLARGKKPMLLPCDSEQLKELKPLVNLVVKFRHKSPALAACLSAIVPGSGKLYTGEWKDGLASFMMVGITAWQSYRGFSRKGLKSAYGYIYAGLSLGFYSGNIYGAWHSARRQNRLNRQKLTIEYQRAILGLL